MQVDKNRVESLLKGDKSYDVETTKDLGYLVDQYPYAPILHFVYLRGLQEENSYKFPSQLNRSSVSTMNRTALFEWAEDPLIPVEVQLAAVRNHLSENDILSKNKMDEGRASITQDKFQSVSKQKETLNVKSNSPAKTSLISNTIGTKEKTDLNSLDLSSLPIKVREQILRSQAIQKKLISFKSQNTDSSAREINLHNSNPLKLNQKDGQTHDRSSLNSENKKETISENSKDSFSNDLIEAVENSDMLKNSARKNKKTSSVLHSDFNFQQLSPFALFLSELGSVQPKSRELSIRDIAKERVILEQFLELNPKIKLNNDANKFQDLTIKTPNVSGLVTETLANHYYEQGVFQKAIQAYEILKLKVPQKSGIFAARISEMRKLQFDKK